MVTVLLNTPFLCVCGRFAFCVGGLFSIKKIHIHYPYRLIKYAYFCSLYTHTCVRFTRIFCVGLLNFYGFVPKLNGIQSKWVPKLNGTLSCACIGGVAKSLGSFLPYFQLILYAIFTYVFTIEAVKALGSASRVVSRTFFNAFRIWMCPYPGG